MKHPNFTICVSLKRLQLEIYATNMRDQSNWDSDFTQDIFELTHFMHRSLATILVRTRILLRQTGDDFTQTI